MDFQPPTPIKPGQDMEAQLAKLQPFVTSFSSQANTGTVAPQKLQTQSSNGNILQGLAGFAGDFAKATVGVIGTVAHTAIDATVHTFTDPVNFVGNLINEWQLSSRVDANQKQIASLSSQVQKISSDYRAGRITQAQYRDGLKNLNGAFDQINKDVNETNTQLEQNAKNTLDTGITTASDVLAIVTAGASKGFSTVAEATAASAGDGSAANVIKFFGQREVGDQLFAAATKIDTVVADVVKNINTATTWNGLFPQGKIALLAHEAIQNSATELTSKQIAQNVAVNLLLKRPIVYQTNIDLATDMYKNLASGNLTGAALEATMVGGMALSGGPIGWVMQAGGKLGETVKAMIFPKGAAADVMRITAAGNKEAEEYIAKAATASASRQSFNNNISLFIGDGTQGQIDQVLANMMGNGETDKVLLWKVLEQTNMKMAGGNAATAAGFLKDFYNSLDDGRWLNSKSAEDLVNHGIAWAKNRELAVQDAIKNGMSKQLAERIVIGRLDASDKKMIIDEMVKVDESFGSIARQGYEGQVTSFDEFKRLTSGAGADLGRMKELQDARIAALSQMLDKYPNAAWTNSETFLADLKSILMNTPHSTEDMAKAIMKIKAGRELVDELSPEVRAQMAKDGHIAVLPKRHTYTPYVSKEEAAAEGLTFKSNAVPDSVKGTPQASLFEHAVAPVPILQGFGRFLTKVGLSPEATQDLVQQSFRDNFNTVSKEALKGTTGSLQNVKGEDIMTKLYDYIREYNGGANSIGKFMPISDLRQMTTKHIKEALGVFGRVSDAEAKAIGRAINTSMLNVPWSVRGLGDKIIDWNMRANPLAAWYGRVQASGHFVWNPFFRVQQGYQTEMLTQMEAASNGGLKMLQLPGLNRVNKVVFGHQWGRIQDTVTQLEDANIFTPHIQVAGTLGMEGRLGTRITPSEKQSLAGLVTQLADNAGISTEEYLKNYEPAVIDLLRTITTNNHTQGVLDSPLVRTINLAFFPFRYNLKVAGMMADKMALLSAPTQVALLTNIYNFNNWMRSDEGVAWQQQHADALKLFNWLSPTYPINYIIKLGEDAIHPDEASISDLGMLGGLPFGLIGQFLEQAGVIDMAPPYVNPTTGEVYPKYVPKTNRALVNLAIQDALGQLFTYPGAIVGLPSKGSILRGISNAIVGGKNDFETQAVTLTPQQQHQQQIIQQEAVKNGEATATQPLAEAKLPDNTVTQVPLSPTASVATPRPVKGRSKKKSDYRPAPL